MISPIKQEKDALRKKYKQIRNTLPPEEKTARDRAICNYAKSLASFRYAEYVLLYAATPDEISLDELAHEALNRGKLVFFPRCNTESKTMTYHAITSPAELYPDSYGIREPSPALPVFEPRSCTGNAVCFVPGLLFDRMGYRLGYGGGYYDRFLSEFCGNRVGVVYTDFIVDSVPRGRFDLHMDILLTEKNVKSIKKD